MPLMRSMFSFTAAIGCNVKFLNAPKLSPQDAAHQRLIVLVLALV